MNIYLLLDLIAGLLIGWDLLISKKLANKINGRLRNWLKPPSSIKQTFIVGIIFATIVMAAIITYSVLKDLQTVPKENVNLLWIPVFGRGFVIGLASQWLAIRVTFFFTKAQQKQEVLNQYIARSSIVLAILASILLISTNQIHYMVILSIGIFYGVAALEFSILLLWFLRRFLTSDPNPLENPRVLARVGLLLFISSKISEFIFGLL